MKKALSILLAGILLLGAFACRQQPVASAPYTDQYTAQLLETASAGESGADNAALKERLGAPERYEASFSGADGKLIVNADVPITLPNVDAMPVMRIKGANFSQELAYRLFNKLSAGEPMFLITGDTGEVTDQIADGTLQQTPRYEHGPDTPLMGMADRLSCTSLEDSDGDQKALYIFNNTVYTNESSYYLHVEGGFFTISPRTSASISYDTSKLWQSLWPEYWSGKMEDVTQLSLDGTPVKTTAMKMTPREARMAAEAFLADCGITELVVDSVLLHRSVLPVGMATPSPVPGLITPTPTLPDSDLTAAEVTEGYVIRLLRMQNGIRVESIEEDLEVQIPGFEAGASWAYEQAIMNISDDGVMWFRWLSPLEMTETVTENAALLPWAEIQDICERMLQVRYAETAGHERTKRMTLTVERVELCLGRIIDQNSYTTGLLIPVWNVYGATEIENQDGSKNAWPVDNHPVLSINAIDGSVIDWTKGY